jgi:hypothetical protein
MAAPTVTKGEGRGLADPVDLVKKLWKKLSPLRKVMGWVFALYGWQMLWRNAQNDEAPFFAFAVVEWFNMARDGLAQGWEWASWLYQRVVELGE